MCCSGAACFPVCFNSLNQAQKSKYLDYLELEQSVKVKGSGFDPIRVSLNKLSISTAKRARFFQRTALIICL